MRYDERLKGYQALLAELESGVNASIPGMPTTNIIGTCPTWVYQDAHRLGRHSAGLCYVPKSLENGIIFDCYGAAKAERMRLQAIDWLNGLIFEGPPKPRLKWEEAPAKNAYPIRFCASAELGGQTIVLVAGVNAQRGRWYYYIAACYTDHPKEWQLDVTRLLWEDQASGIPDGGYPAPFLEAEEALHNLLSAALDALNNPKP